MAGSQEKSEKPTGKKLGDARKRGRIARSTDLTSLTVLMAGGITALLSGRLIMEHFHRLLNELWGGGFQVNAGSMPGSEQFVSSIKHFLLMITPIIMATVISAVGTNVFQTKGILFAFDSLKPDFSRLNPINGLKRYFSLRSLVELAKSAMKVAIIGYAVYSVLQSQKTVMLALPGMEISEIAGVLGATGFKILIRTGSIMLILSLSDFYYQRWQYMKDLRMSKQEVKEEAKQTEGNPQIKSRIRFIQRALVRQRMMAKVPKASLVITNPTHYAVAILYSPQMEAPKVVAKGLDFLAKKIIKTARKHGVPVVQNPPLARALYHQVKLEEVIPVNLYKATAKMLAYIYQQKRAKSR